MEKFKFQLVESLVRLGIEAEREFTVPGTRRRVDLFLPQLPRAAVEVRAHPNGSGLKACLTEIEALHAGLSADLGPAYRTLLLLVGPPAEPGWTTSPQLHEGVVVLPIAHQGSLEQTAEAAAARIQEALVSSRKTILGLPAHLAAGGALATGVLGAVVTTGVVGFIARGPFELLLAAPAQALEWLAAKRAGKKATTTSPPRLSPPIATDQARPSSASLAEEPPGEEVNAVARQARGILAPFHDLAPESYPVLVHEMGFLVEEYRRGHWTACALRGGRSLEFIVYELARRWNIEVQDGAFGRINELRIQLDHIADLEGDFQVTSGEAREKVRVNLIKAWSRLSGMTTGAAMELQSQAPSGEVPPGPRSVLALLKRIRKKHGSVPGVPEEINPLLDKGSEHTPKGPVHRIMDTRNRAAHADASGTSQEADPASVRSLLEDLLKVMLALSNVGVGIQVEKARVDQAKPRAPIDS